MSTDLTNGSSREAADASTANVRNVTVGLGAKPRHDVGLFAYATDTKFAIDLRSPSLPDDRYKLLDSRADIGINLKFRSDNQLWLKAGGGRQSFNIAGAFVSPDTATVLNDAFSTTIFSKNAVLDGYQSTLSLDDLQVRHSIGNDQRSVTWGVEKSRLSRTSELVNTFNPARLRVSQDQAMHATDVYLSWKEKQVGPFTLQADIWRQAGKIDRTDLSTLDLLTTAGLDFTLQNIPRQQKYSEFNPRLGMVWHAEPLQTARLVTQRWRRPASVSSLGPIDTLGIPVNDRLPLPGGLYSRTRMQFDQEIAGRWYAQAFVDHERIDNGINGVASIVPNLQLSSLESLRNRREVFTAVADIENTADFEQGTVDTVGFTGNFLLGQKQSISVRYLHRAARQLGANTRLRIPFIPLNLLRVASQWSLPERWLLGASATYRSARFRDAQNLQTLSHGWNFGMTAFWESADKRSSVQAILDNLIANKNSGASSFAQLTMRYTYKF